MFNLFNNNNNIVMFWYAGEVIKFVFSLSSLPSDEFNPVQNTRRFAATFATCSNTFIKPSMLFRALNVRYASALFPEVSVANLQVR